jgi:hypothetical protein
MKRLTPAQIYTLNKISVFMPVGNTMKYDNIKVLSECKSFDGSFNALLSAGYFKSVQSNNFDNNFLRLK